MQAWILVAARAPLCCIEVPSNQEKGFDEGRAPRRLWKDRERIDTAGCLRSIAVYQPMRTLQHQRSGLQAQLTCWIRTCRLRGISSMDFPRPLAHAARISEACTQEKSLSSHVSMAPAILDMRAFGLTDRRHDCKGVVECPTPIDV